jgi:hypothetical protein
MIDSSSDKTSEADDAAGRAAILRRLDAIVLLLLEAGASPSRTMTEKVVRLLDLGFSASETAAMVGKKSNYVAAIRIQAAGNRGRTGRRREFR